MKKIVRQNRPSTDSCHVPKQAESLIQATSQDQGRRQKGSQKKLTPMQVALSQMSPVKEVLLLHCDEASVMYVRDMYIDQVSRRQSKTGLLMPTVHKVTSLYAGPPRQIEVMRKLFDSQSDPTANVPVSFEGESKYGEHDLLSDEGVNTLRPYIGVPNSCTVFEQRITPDRVQRTMDNLKEIRMIAASANSFVIPILVGYSGIVDDSWQRVADEVVEIRKCESGPGEEFAFSIDCHSLRIFSAYGAGTQMCSMRTGENRLQRKYETFLSADARERAYWKLRYWGNFSNIQIASEFKVARSTVDRIVHKLGGPRDGSLTDEWIADARRLFGLDAKAFTTAQKDA
jgi:hypothetical protein